MSRTSFTKVYSRKPTQCRSLCHASDSKRSQNACGNFIENRKPTSCSILRKLVVEKNKNRLGGGGNDTSNEGKMHNGRCCSSASKPCSVKSTKTLSSSSPPPPSCCRSYKHQQIEFQRHEPPPRRPERFQSVKGNCPCSGSSGQAGHDNQNGRCGSTKSKELSCKCICQSCKSSQVQGEQLQGGCGGQSCGKMYSCAGSSGGKSCFPRNTKRRDGGECCGGTNSGNHGSCCS